MLFTRTQEYKKCVFAGKNVVQKHTFCTPQLISNKLYHFFMIVNENYDEDT